MLSSDPINFKPSWSYSSSFDFSLLGFVISEALVSIPPFVLFLTARFSSLLQSRSPPSFSRYLALLLLACFIFNFQKALRWPTFLYSQASHIPGLYVKTAFPLSRYFFFFFFFFLPSALLSLAAPLNRTRSVAAMCATPTSYLTVLFLDPLSRPGSRAALIKSLSASPISKMWKKRGKKAGRRSWNPLAQRELHFWPWRKNAD